MGMTSPEDGAAEQAVHVFTLSFDSDGYDDHGHPDYANGEHTISAELEIGVTMADGMHGHETISSNVDRRRVQEQQLHRQRTLRLSLGHDSALDEQRQRARVWHGPDPDASSVEIRRTAGSLQRRGGRVRGRDAQPVLRCRRADR